MIILTSTAFALSVLVGSAGVGVAETRSPMSVAQLEALTGTVKSADMSAKTFAVTTDTGEERKASWNDDTVFLLDGEDSDAASVLVTNGKIRASLDENGVATSVSRWSE